MAQSASETVYLKNGSIIKCTIIEQIPNETIKIMTSDGSIFVYNMSDVIKITKEIPSNDANSRVSALSLASNGTLLSTRNNDLFLGSKKLSSEEALQLLGKDTYDTFRSACRQVRTGNTFSWIGIGLLAPSIFFFIQTYDNSLDYDEISTYSTLFYSSALLADIGICLGFIFQGCGNGRKNWVIDSYNDQVKNYSINIAPTILYTPTSVSNFSQYAMGASLRITF